MTSISSLLSSARRWMKKVGGATLLSTFLEVEPAPACRPKFTRIGHVYYGRPYERFRQEAIAALEGFEGTPTDAALVALVEIVVPKPKTGKLIYPRGDIDNFIKGPLDAATKCGRIWDDDNQIVGLIAIKRYAEPGEKTGVRLEWITV